MDTIILGLCFIFILFIFVRVLTLKKENRREIINEHEQEKKQITNQALREMKKEYLEHVREERRKV